MRALRFVPVFASWLLVLTGAHAGEISDKGQKLAAALDRMDVEKLWLAGKYVQWESGKPLNKEVTDNKPHTHCSAFAASACKKLGVYLLRPKAPEDRDNPKAKGHSATLLANAQFDWLGGEGGREDGWRPVALGVEAQRLANQGSIVVATYKSKDATKSGHIALVRPGTRSAREVEADGPDIIQAGKANHVRTTVREGFKAHPYAWEKDRRVRFYVHDWPAK